MLPSQNLRISLLVAVLTSHGFVAAGSEPHQDTAIPAAGVVVTEEAGTEAPAARADLSEANRLVQNELYAEAAKHLRLLREEHPDDSALLMMLGEVLLATGEPAASVEALQRSAEIDPSRERLQLQLGAALAATGETEMALQAFERELENSEDPRILVTARLNRSLLLQRELRWDEAAEELEMALQFQPDRTQLYADLAAIYAEAGRLEDAEKALRRGAAFGFRSASHAYSLGARFYRDGRYEDAERLFRSTLEIDPSLAAAERSLAATLEKLGRNREAAEHLRRYMELDPDSVDRDRIHEQIRAAETD